MVYRCKYNSFSRYFQIFLGKDVRNGVNGTYLPVVISL